MTSSPTSGWAGAGDLEISQSPNSSPCAFRPQCRSVSVKRLLEFRGEGPARRWARSLPYTEFHTAD